MNQSDANIEKIPALIGIDKRLILSIFPYGSRVYGTNSQFSDHDYQVVCDNSCNNDGQQYDSHGKTISVHTHTKNKWEDHIKQHKIFALESIFQDEKYKMKIDHQLLRQEISARSSNSWVRCKKKLTVEDDQYAIGIKSLFHSFRIPMFGIQIATHGRIVDYTAANALWHDEMKQLLAEDRTWEHIYDTYKGRHNTLMTEFRKVAEKGK